MTHLPVIVRAAETQHDLDGISKIDRTYSTDRIYRVRRSELGFWLDEEPVSPPVHKIYPDPSPELSDRLLVATAGAEIVGYGELRFNSWNDRAEIECLTVPGDHRGLAMAYKLIESAQRRWRVVNAPHLVAVIRAGKVFVNGKLAEQLEDQEPSPSPAEMTAEATG